MVFNVYSGRFFKVAVLILLKSKNSNPSRTRLTLLDLALTLRHIYLSGQYASFGQLVVHPACYRICRS